MGVCKILLLVGVIATVYIGYTLKEKMKPPPLPVLDQNFWWGPGEARKVDESIRPFKIQVPSEVINDLNDRLDRFLKITLTPPLEHQGFQYGFNTNYLKDVITHWRKKYNWKEREVFLNKFPQYKTMINGLDLHFIRVTPKNAVGKKVVPLLLLHGWPGSVREFYELIPLLTTPRDDADFVFDVVAPSLPGYGFSQGAAKTGLGNIQMAVVMNNLMKRIGFDKYYIQGGDWGAIISSNMGVLYPKNVLGVHANMCGVQNGISRLKWFIGSIFPSLVVEEKYQHKMYPISKTIFYLFEESGYFHIQATKPDTIGTVLSDTPAGLATYILEKFSTWTNPSWKTLDDGGLTKKYNLDNLLDNIMIYWVTKSITTSQRLYAESFTHKHTALGMDEIPITVPTACARFHHDLMWQSESLLREKYHNLLHLSDFEDGGHFAAFEVPQLLNNDVWTAVQKFQNYYKNSNKKEEL